MNVEERTKSILSLAIVLLFLIAIESLLANAYISPTEKIEKTFNKDIESKVQVVHTNKTEALALGGRVQYAYTPQEFVGYAYWSGNVSYSYFSQARDVVTKTYRVQTADWAIVYEERYLYGGIGFFKVEKYNQDSVSFVTDKEAILNMFILVCFFAAIVFFILVYICACPRTQSKIKGKDKNFSLLFIFLQHILLTPMASIVYRKQLFYIGESFG